MDFGVDFCRFLDALGADFLVFWALETGLEIMIFCDANGPCDLELGTPINVRFEPSKEIKA